MFGIENFKQYEERLLESLENKELGVENIPFEVTWRSTLSLLLKPENQSILQDFLLCREATATARNAHRKERPEGQCDFYDAETAWIKIEKRIRAAIVRSFTSSEVIRQFLHDMERVILHFAHTRSCPAWEVVPDALRKDVTQQPFSLDKAGNLVVPLQDSAFRRLLVHGVAQFYGLQSKV